MQKLLATVVMIPVLVVAWFYLPLPPTQEAAQRQRFKTGISLGSSSTPHETFQSYLKYRRQESAQ